MSVQVQQRDRVCRMIAEQLNIAHHLVLPEKSVVDLGGDSLDEIEIIMAVEDEFGINIPDDVAETCKSVQDLLNLIPIDKALAPSAPQTPAVSDNPLPAESDVLAVMDAAGFHDNARSWSGGPEEMAHVIRAARAAPAFNFAETIAQAAESVITTRSALDEAEYLDSETIGGADAKWKEAKATYLTALANLHSHIADLRKFQASPITTEAPHE